MYNDNIIIGYDVIFNYPLGEISHFGASRDSFLKDTSAGQMLADTEH